MEISIIIPVYNAEDSIFATLESVRKQTYQDFEIIIINDGSKDSSEIIINKYIETNTTLEIKFVSQVNQGVSKSRNVGMKMAKGNWIALLDSDDEWLPNKLERQIQILKENPIIDFLGSNRNGEYFEKFFNLKFEKLTKISAKNLLYKMFFITPTVIFKKDILDDIGCFDERRKYAEDAYYFIKIAQRKSCYLLNESLVITSGGKAYFGEKGLSSNLWSMQRGEILNIQYALKSSIINILEYCFLFSFLMLKYFRRVWLVKIKK